MGDERKSSDAHARSHRRGTARRGRANKNDYRRWRRNAENHFVLLPQFLSSCAQSDDTRTPFFFLPAAPVEGKTIITYARTHVVHTKRWDRWNLINDSTDDRSVLARAPLDCTSGSVSHGRHSLGLAHSLHSRSENGPDAQSRWIPIPSVATSLSSNSPRRLLCRNCISTSYGPQNRFKNNAFCPVHSEIYESRGQSQIYVLYSFIYFKLDF